MKNILIYIMIGAIGIPLLVVLSFLWLAIPYMILKNIFNLNPKEGFGISITYVIVNLVWLGATAGLCCGIQEKYIK